MTKKKAFNQPVQKPAAMPTAVITMPDLWQQSVIKILKTMPTTWSGNAYFGSLSALDQKALTILVTVGIAECRVDIVVAGTSTVLLYETRGLDWANSVARRGILDSGTDQSDPNVVFGGNVYEFRMTSRGEEARNSLSLGLVEGVIFMVENGHSPFMCQKICFESYQRHQARSATGVTAVAAAQANASIGDTIIHNHIYNQIHVPPASSSANGGTSNGDVNESKSPVDPPVPVSPVNIEIEPPGVDESDLIIGEANAVKKHTEHEPHGDDPPESPPAELLHNMNTQGRSIVSFLWTRRHATQWISLPQNCWQNGSPTSDQNDRTVRSALERVQGELNKLSRFCVTLEIKGKNMQNGTVKLLHK